MPKLIDHFSGFQEFVDPRQDQLSDVYRALYQLRNVNASDSNEILRTISGLNLQRIHRMYQNKCSEMRNGNRSTQYALQSMSFRNCKAVMGDNDYV